MPQAGARVVSSDPEVMRKREMKRDRQARWRENKRAREAPRSPRRTPPREPDAVLPPAPSPATPQPPRASSVLIEPRDAEMAGQIGAYLHVEFLRRRGRAVRLDEGQARAWLRGHPLLLPWLAEHLTGQGLGVEFGEWLNP